MKKLSIRKKALVFTATALSALAVTGAVSASAADTQVTCYKGDVNIDYVVNIKDLSFMYKYINHTKDDFTSDQLEIADVNGDSDVNIKDYSLVYKHINKTKEIQPNHSYVETVVAPTETANGYTLHKCAVCGDEYKDNYVDASGQPVTETTEATSQTTTEPITEQPTTEHTTHSYTAVVTAPTCEDQGYTTYTCSCGDSYTDNFVAPLSHTWSEWVLCNPDANPTCEDTLWDLTMRSSTCSRCGKVIKDGYGGHDLVLVETYEPTCTEYGWSVYECSKCGEQFEDWRVVEPTGHFYSHETDVVVEPTCTEDGYTLRTCSACGGTEKINYVDECHNYVETVVAPTDSTLGYTMLKCTKCGDVDDVYDYVNSDGQILTAPTQSADYEAPHETAALAYHDVYRSTINGEEVTETLPTDEFTRAAKNWLDQNVTYSNLSTLEKVRLINEYTLELLKDTVSEDGTVMYSDGEVTTAQRWDEFWNWELERNEMNRFTKLCATGSYREVFSALCISAGIEIYQDLPSTNRETYYVIENGVKYYTCPLLNAFYSLDRYGAETANTYTNMPEGSDIYEQFEEKYASFKNNSADYYNTVYGRNSKWGIQLFYFGSGEYVKTVKYLNGIRLARIL